MEFINWIYNKFLLNPVLMSLGSGIVGVIIGVVASYKLKDHELKLYEKATALSIIEELKVLKELYEQEFNEQYEKLEENTYLNIFYEITQDYTTIYTQNAAEIGLIKNKKLRNLIIKSYLLINRYIEELKIYKNLYNNHYSRNKNFVASAFPKLIDKDCSEIDTDTIINGQIIQKMIANDSSWCSNPYLTEAQITCFYNSYDTDKKHLCSFSNKLKNEYLSLKETISETLLNSKETYGE